MCVERGITPQAVYAISKCDEPFVQRPIGSPIQVMFQTEEVLKMCDGRFAVKRCDFSACK